jgi:hypothetical protein
VSDCAVSNLDLHHIAPLEINCADYNIADLTP